MTEQPELEGLDPFDLLDREAARLDAFFAQASDDDWSRPSRCDAWTVRDVLGHLISGEDYHHACLDGRVAEFLGAWGARGAADLDTANAMGVADYAGMTPEEAVAHWRDRNADGRARFRARADGTIDTSIGDYPNRWQAFHVASELATHADDVGVPVTDGERAERLAWRARFSRFALAEAKPNLQISVGLDSTVVADGTTTVEVDDETLVEAVAGRLDDASSLDPTARSMLNTMP